MPDNGDERARRLAAMDQTSAALNTALNTPAVDNARYALEEAADNYILALSENVTAAPSMLVTAAIGVVVGYTTQRLLDFLEDLNDF